MIDLSCPTCGEPLAATDNFCEGCGATLTGVHVETDEASANGPVAVGATGSFELVPGDSVLGARCVDCAGPVVVIDGSAYCEGCGRLQPNATDHSEIVLSGLAGVTDRGRVHSRNEDAMALHRADETFAVVVCDGVSTSQLADQASTAAAHTALEVMIDGLADPAASPVDVTLAAIEAAQAVVAAMPWDRSKPLEAPSCTFVSAVHREGEPVVVASIGDARAYWFGAGEPRRLSIDDSWAADQIAMGVDPATAEADRRAHSITRWLGRDAPEIAPHVTTIAAGTSGRLLVCSDGLWNYASAPSQLVAMVETGAPLEAACTLTDFALAHGGHDNITVVVIDVDDLTADEPNVDPHISKEAAT